MSERGKKGGRPRTLTLDEMRQQALQREQNKNNEKGGIHPSCKSADISSMNNMKVLKRMFAELRGSSEEAKIKEGEAVVATAVSPGGGNN